MKEGLQVFALLSILSFGSFQMIAKDKNIRIKTSKGYLLIGERAGESGIFFITNKNGSRKILTSKVVFNSTKGNCGFDFLGKIVGAVGKEGVSFRVRQNDDFVEMSANRKGAAIRLEKKKSDKSVTRSSIQVGELFSKFNLRDGNKKVLIEAGQDKAFLLIGNGFSDVKLMARKDGSSMLLSDKKGNVCGIGNKAGLKGFILKKEDKVQAFVGEKNGKPVLFKAK